jgi:hypothetical protein
VWSETSAAGEWSRRRGAEVVDKAQGGKVEDGDMCHHVGGVACGSSSSQVQILQCQTINIRVNDFHSATWITISTKPNKTDSNRFRRFKKTNQINLIFF